MQTFINSNLMLVNINVIKVNVKEAVALVSVETLSKVTLTWTSMFHNQTSSLHSGLAPFRNLTPLFIIQSISKIKSHPTLQRFNLKKTEGLQILYHVDFNNHKADAHLLRAGAPTVAFNPKPQSLALPTETRSREEAASKQWQLDKRTPLSSPVH